MGNPYTMSPNYKIPKTNTGELPSRDLVTWHVHFIKSVCFCLRGLLTFSWENSLRQKLRRFPWQTNFCGGLLSPTCLWNGILMPPFTWDSGNKTVSVEGFNPHEPPRTWRGAFWHRAGQSAPSPASKPNDVSMCL